MIKFRDLLMAIIVLTIVIFMWSWASNIAPSFFLKTDHLIHCAECPYTDLSRCDICIGQGIGDQHRDFDE